MGSVIKAHHNCGSDGTTYSGKLVRIKHKFSFRPASRVLRGGEPWKRAFLN